MELSYVINILAYPLKRNEIKSDLEFIRKLFVLIGEFLLC